MTFTLTVPFRGDTADGLLELGLEKLVCRAAKSSRPLRARRSIHFPVTAQSVLFRSIVWSKLHRGNRDVHACDVVGYRMPLPKGRVVPGACGRENHERRAQAHRASDGRKRFTVPSTAVTLITYRPVEMAGGKWENAGRVRLCASRSILAQPDKNSRDDSGATLQQGAPGAGVSHKHARAGSTPAPATILRAARF